MTQNSQPLIQPNGAITDTYLSLGTLSGQATGRPLFREHPASLLRTASGGIPLVARTSTDGGAAWSSESVIAPDTGGGPADIRCCLDAAVIAPASGTMYAVWDGYGPGEPVTLASSADGGHWSAPVLVTPGDRPSIQHVNAAVAAYDGKVFVSYGTRDTAVDHGTFVQQQVSWSYDGGVTFGSALSLGPLSNLKYAAVAPVPFPGDYSGASETASRVTLVWCVSRRPRNLAQKYHQVLFAAVLRP